MQRLKGIQLAIASALLCVGFTTQAAFPEKSIHLIVPFPPNGTTDVVARRISQKLGEALGQTVVIENKGGAGATIGTQIVASAPADGYTLLMATNSHTANPSIYKSLGYDSVKSFTSVIMVGDTPGLVVIHPSVPAKTLPEFIALAKKRHLRCTMGPRAPAHFLILPPSCLSTAQELKWYMSHTKEQGLP